MTIGFFNAMPSSASSLPSPAAAAAVKDEEPVVFDASILQSQAVIPPQFIWPDDEKARDDLPELPIPLVDLTGFLAGDLPATEEAAAVVGEACRKHGFFMVVNHGVPAELVSAAHRQMDDFFGLPLSAKSLAKRNPGEHCGYASSFTGRFSSKLPWKETLSFRYSDGDDQAAAVESYFVQKMGEGFRRFGEVCRDYTRAMNGLALKLTELLGISMGLRREIFRELFDGGDSVMRLNHYPPCRKPDLTLGTGPHCDPTALTILHQEEVKGLQVFVDGQWQWVSPRFDTFVVNIGDTFMALSNGGYRSCLHRAVVNEATPRRSAAFFLCPRKEAVVRPPPELVAGDSPQRYPDFTWPMLLEFTQKHYRSDERTLDAFAQWVQRASTSGVVA